MAVDLGLPVVARAEPVRDPVYAALDGFRRSGWGVGLVSMPFASQLRPSIQIGLLAEIARGHGFPARTMHLGLDLAALIGPELYEALCEYGRTFAGDWLFSREAFGDRAPADGDDYLVELAEPTEDMLHRAGTDPGHLRTLRDEVIPGYLDALVANEEWAGLRVVGFTSTFQQNVASFALARRLKRAFPHLVTVFGGANFDGTMGAEWMRTVDVVDHVVAGEGDATFPELLVALSRGDDPAAVPGVLSRRDGRVVAGPPRGPTGDLDALPDPDYDEYFARAERLGLLSTGATREVDLPFESGRGCWWGAKHHCTFCGLNGSTMAFRAKSARRVEDGLHRATRRYRSWRHTAVDNILGTGLLRELLPTLRDGGHDYDLFYEIKANLARDDIRMLAASGVKRIQPGIESLSSHVLALMRKGTTAAQNVNTLRWAAYYGVDVAWNLLHGFPGETEQDYRAQAELMRAVVHLQPPGEVGRIWMERFSPIFVERDEFPVEFRRPHRAYRYIYPGEIDLDEVAYFFEYRFVEELPDDAVAGTRAALDAWRTARAAPVRPALTYRTGGGFVQVTDTRDPDNPGTYTFRDELAALLTAASARPVGLRRLAREVLPGTSEQEVADVVGSMCANGLMMRDGDSVLTLALPATGGR